MARPDSRHFEARTPRFRTRHARVVAAKRQPQVAFLAPRKNEGIAEGVRQNVAKIVPEFAWWVLANNATKLAQLGRGATFKQINRSDIEGLEIPLPPLADQRRIAAILDQADGLRRKRRKTLKKLKALATSIFVDTFEKNGKQYPILPLKLLIADAKIGLVRSSEEFGEDFSFPYVRMVAISRNGEFETWRVLRTNATDAELADYRLVADDFLFNTRNSRELVGKTALFPGAAKNTLFNNNIMRIQFNNSVVPAYIAAAFQRPSIQAELETRKSGTTSVFAIYSRELKTLPVPIPPIGLQRAFAARVSEINKLKAVHRAHLEKLDALFASLQHRAFCGERTQ